MHSHSFTSTAYKSILLRRDGQPRRFSRRILFVDGRPRRLIGRLFFKKSGRVRPHFSTELREFLEGNALSRWIRDFDTPSIEFLKKIDSEKRHASRILVVLPLSKEINELRQRVAALFESQGADFDILGIPEHNSDCDDAIWSVLSAKGHAVFGRENVELERYNTVIYVGIGINLRSHAVWSLAEGLSRAPALQAIYSDAASMKNGSPSSHWFKPNFSPVLARSISLFGGCFAIRANLFKDFLLGQSGSVFLIDFVRRLEVSLSERQVGHLPFILYFGTARIDENNSPRCIVPDVSPPVEYEPTISVIIPTRNRWDLLHPCIDSVLDSDWPKEKLEVVVVDNASNEEETILGLKRYAEELGVRVLRDERPFNYSQLNNFAVVESRGELLVFLNNDTVVRDSRWLHKLSQFAMQPGAGAVGAKLLYPDETIQHVGVVLGIQGGAGHVFVGLRENDSGYHGLASYDREVSAVTGACLAVRRDAFLAAGKFDENLKVAFNDIALCARLTEEGKQNYLVADPLIIHHESKTRGYSTTRSKQIAELKEAIYTRQRFNSIFRNDPFYSPNLSLNDPYEIASPPRRRNPWKTRDGRKNVLVLSSVHRRGYGVPVVIDRQVSALVGAGFNVTVGGPFHEDDFSYPGADRVALSSAEEAASWAFTNDVGLIWAHTPPFFSVARWVAGQIPMISYDYGEPPPAFFPDWKLREGINLEKTFAFAMADQTYAISKAVLDESLVPLSGVIPLGNDHLSRWSGEYSSWRDRIRERMGWKDHTVVLNVCRFSSGERHYKGIDTYIEVMRDYCLRTSQIDGQVRFIVCGRGERDDVEALRSSGLEVFANVTDEQLLEMYVAADIYANFSRWEGYNLGIAQALAMGLAVVASDTPAHRAFGVSTPQSVSEASSVIEEIISQKRERVPVLWPWAEHESMVVRLTAEAMIQARQSEH